MKNILGILFLLHIFVFGALYNGAGGLASKDKKSLPGYVNERTRNIINSVVNDYLSVINYKTDYLPKIYMGSGLNKTFNAVGYNNLYNITIGTNYYYKDWLLIKLQMNYQFGSGTPELYNKDKYEYLTSNVSFLQPTVGIGYPMQFGKRYLGFGVIIGYNQISEKVNYDNVLDNKIVKTVYELPTVYSFLPGVFVEFHSHLFYHIGLLCQMRYFYNRIDLSNRNINMNNFTGSLSFTYDY